MDERWLNDPLTFFSDMGERPLGGTLERRDNEKGYSPNNCYWATMKEQQNNKRTNIVVSYKGRAQTLSQWAEEFDLSRPTVFFRYHKGLPLEVVFFKGTLLNTQYSDNGVTLYESHGVALTVSEWHKLLESLGERRTVSWLRQKLLNLEEDALAPVPKTGAKELAEAVLGYPVKPAASEESSPAQAS